MPTYIILAKWTQQGIQNVEHSPDRLDAAKQLAESLDGKITEFYLTFGEYDGIIVSEFPDDETSAQFALRAASGGNIRTMTLRGFPEDEYRQLIDNLPS